MTVIIQKIDLEDVIKFDKQKYNSNNHWKNNIEPHDYSNVIESFYVKHWISNFKTDYKVIKINEKKHLDWMKKADIVSSQTGIFSKLFQDELDDFIEEYAEKYKDIFYKDSKYFVRSEEVSLKYGQHKTGPYNNLHMIIESLVSCTLTHKPIHSETDEITLYLFPWIYINPKNEYRIFVYNNNITAISQQNIYKSLDVESVIDNNIQIIIDYYNLKIKNSINQINFVYDFAILENNEPYFIEFNSFGKEYSSGSALFHWLIDEDLLYNSENNIYVRYTV